MNKFTSVQPMDQRQNLNRNQENLELNDNKNSTYKNLWDAIKVVPGGKITALNVYIKKKKG